MQIQRTFVAVADARPVLHQAGIPRRARHPGALHGAVSKETEPPRDPASPRRGTLSNTMFLGWVRLLRVNCPATKKG